MFPKKKRAAVYENEAAFSIHEDDVNEYGSLFSEGKASSAAAAPETKKNTAADYNLATESSVSQRSFVELQTQVLRQQYGLCGF